MKPDRPTAMHNLLNQIENALPLGLPETELCAGTCVGCPKKLNEFMLGEMDFWRDAMARGDVPSLGDIKRLARSAQKIHHVFSKNPHLQPLLNRSNPAD